MQGRRGGDARHTTGPITHRSTLHDVREVDCVQLAVSCPRPPLVSVCPSVHLSVQQYSQPATGIPDNTTSLMSKTTKSVKKGGGHEWQAVFREIARSCSTINNNRYALQSGRRVTRTGGRKREITYDRFLTE